MDNHISPAYDIDIAGANITRLAQIAKNMPPAWDGARIAHYAGMPDGGQIGLVLPGRGLKLTCDLKELGITRPIPYVYEDTPTRHLMDMLGSERGAITTYDGIIAARCGGLGQDLTYTKASLVTVGDLWSAMSSVGSGVPQAMTFTAISGGAAHINTNAGAWSLGMSNPAGSSKKYLLTLGWAAAQQVNFMVLADLLVAAGGISATINTSQTVNTTALTRYTTGAGVMGIYEVTTQIGTTASNLTTTYTNSTPTGSRSTGAQLFTTSAIVGRLLPITLGLHLPLQAGDFGITSVQTAQLSAAMSAGAFCLQLYYPLAFCPGVQANQYTERDSTVQIDGITELVNASQVLGCLQIYVLPSTSSTGIMNVFLRTCEG